MYHRFDENKYPSTNIRLEDFKLHIQKIENLGFKFISYKEFEEHINKENLDKKLFLTIDDGFTSFYENAWPVLKEKKIPFVLFVNTETVGANGYMNWEEIKEVAESEFGHIGNHSHSHEYLVDKSDLEIENDLKTSIKIFKEKLNYETKFFAYPFGEYKNSFKEIVKNLGFKYAFGQHSGVIDKTKDNFELPRFPINEKYGELKRFETVLKTIPFPYKKIIPEEKYIKSDNNPPKVEIVFFDNNNISLKNITCYSNEENKWKETKIKFLDHNRLSLILVGKFITERGRINCSLREKTGEWRWLGIQFVIAEK